MTAVALSAQAVCVAGVRFDESQPAALVAKAITASLCGVIEQSGGVVEQVEFSDRWTDWRGDDEESTRARSRIEAELRREVAHGHQLAGVDVSAIAACHHCDDVVLRTSDGRFAVVHLSYPKGRSRSAALAAHRDARQH